VKAILLCCWRCTHHDYKGTCCGSSGQRSRFTIALTRRLAVACGFTAGQFRRHCRVAPRKWWSSRPAESSTDTRRFASTASAAQSTAHRPRSKAGTRRGRHPLPTSSDYFRRRRPSHLVRRNLGVVLPRRSRRCSCPPARARRRVVVDGHDPRVSLSASVSTPHQWRYIAPGRTRFGWTST
jgi:hypothetical protein